MHFSILLSSAINLKTYRVKGKFTGQLPWAIRYPSVPKKKFYLWITLGITWDMSSCTSEEQVTLHIENCMGCPHFHKWKFKWKFFEVLRDFTCSLYSFFVWPVTCRWLVPSESLGKIRIFPWVFTCEVTCKMRFICLIVYLPFIAVLNPLQDFYWHKTFRHPLSANGTHWIPSKFTYYKLRSMHNILNLM